MELIINGNVNKKLVCTTQVYLAFSLMHLFENIKIGVLQEYASHREWPEYPAKKNRFQFVVGVIKVIQQPTLLSDGYN